MRTRPFNLQEALAGKPFGTAHKKVIDFHYWEHHKTDKLSFQLEGDYCTCWADDNGVASEGGIIFMIVTPHKELPEFVRMPSGYRLLESGELIPVGALVFNESFSRFMPFDNSVLGQKASPGLCVIVPDYSTGLWKADDAKEAQ